MQKEEIRLVRLGDIQPHPLNSFFFDDIAGDKWEDFKLSVADGLINNPILTDKLITVSGHQRFRAMRENGMNDDTMVRCTIRWYANETEILRELIETNIQQRGTLTCSAVKMGRIAMALEEINKVRRGRPAEIPNNVGNSEPAGKTQAEIAAMLNQNMETYRQNKKLAQLPPEFQAMIEEGRITPTTGARLIARMDESSQQKLLQLLPSDVMRRFTQADIQQYIDQINQLQENLELANNALTGGTDEWLRLSNERDQAVQKARTEYERAASLQKESKQMEKRLEKMQGEWEFAQARADCTMFEGTAFALIDSTLNGFIRSMDFIKQKDHPLAGLNPEQVKYINTLFGKSMQLAREVSQILRAA